MSASPFRAAKLPAWTAAGTRVGDFWAPEIARVGDEYWLVYTARDSTHLLASALPRASRRRGRGRDIGRPLLGGGTIDGHIFVDSDGQPYLFWKEDRNGIWPRKLAAYLRTRPELIDRIFDEEEDRRTAHFAASVVSWASTRRPIERFFLMQPFIGAAVDNYERVRQALEAGDDTAELLHAMSTPILAQRLAADGRSLVGSPTTVIANDQVWEGHLVEGPFLWQQGEPLFPVLRRQRLHRPGLRHRRRGRRQPARPVHQAPGAAAQDREELGRARPRVGRGRPGRAAAHLLPRLLPRHGRLQRVPGAADGAARVQRREASTVDQ